MLIHFYFIFKGFNRVKQRIFFSINKNQTTEQSLNVFIALCDSPPAILLVLLVF